MSPIVPSGNSGPSERLYGCPTPRIAVPGPARELTPDTTYGFDVIEFAELIGEPLYPHEEEIVKRVLEIDEASGQLRFRKAVVMAGRQNGKSRTAAIIALWRMLQFVDRQLILGTAQDLAQSTYAWTLTLQVVRDCPWLEAERAWDNHTNGRFSFGFRNGSEYRVAASNEQAGRGLSVSLLLFDELRTHQSWDAYSAQASTTLAVPNSQILMMSNAGSSRSVVLNHLRSVALAGGDDQLLWLEWSAPDGCDASDPAMWQLANPLLGHRIPFDAMQSMYDSTPLDQFRRENLCQYTEYEDTALDPAAWAACSDAGGSLEGARGRWVACFDSAPDGRHATLCVAARQPDGKIRVEVAGYWDSTAQARGELTALLDRIRPTALAWYPPSELAAILRSRPGSAELGGQKAAEACMGLSGLVEARGLVHGGQELLDAHVCGAQWTSAGDGQRFTRKGGHVDGAYAAAGAVHLAANEPPTRRARLRFINL